MSRFETSIQNPELAKQLDGLSPESVEIALSSCALSRLNSFMDIYVDQPVLTFGVNGVLKEYAFSEFSGFGTDGSLLHVRNRVGGTSPDDKVVILGSIDFDDQLVAMSPKVDRWTNPDSSFEMRMQLDTLPPPSFEDIVAETQEARELQQLLAAEAYRRETPMLINANNNWKFALGRSKEDLSDLKILHEQVQLAVRRGFGAATLEALRVVEPIRASGQLQQNMVA